MIRKIPRALSGALAVGIFGVLVGTFGVLVWPIAAGSNEPEEDDAERFTRGVKAWAEHCGRCHNIRDPKEFPDYEWDVIVNHMRVRANLPGKVARDIETYLKAAN